MAFPIGGFRQNPASSAFPTGPAGGDLTGTYPNPLIGRDRIQSVSALEFGSLAGDMQPTLQAAIDWAGTVSADIFVPYGGSGRLDSPLTFNKAGPVGFVFAGSPSGNPFLRRNFAGDFIIIDGPAAVRFQNLEIYDSSVGAARAGAAIKFQDTAGVRPGYCLFDNVRVTSDDAAGAWERIIDADGTNNALGIRDIHWRDCYFFGARTHNIRAKRFTNWSFTNCFAGAAPTAITQSILFDSVGATSDTLLANGVDWSGTLTLKMNNIFIAGKHNGTVVIDAAATNGKLLLIGPTVSGVANNAPNSVNVELYRDMIGQAFTHYANASSNAAWAVRTVGDTGDRVFARGDGLYIWGDGAGSIDTFLARRNASQFRIGGDLRLEPALGGAGGSVVVATVGQGLNIAEGANARMGTDTLVGGTKVVATTAVTANSRIICFPQTLGTLLRPTALGVTARTAGTSFTVTSLDVTDTSTFAWMLFEPGV